jgi:hypothetical protein
MTPLFDSLLIVRYYKMLSEDIIGKQCSTRNKTIIANTISHYLHASVRIPFNNLLLSTKNLLENKMRRTFTNSLRNG